MLCFLSKQKLKGVYLENGVKTSQLLEAVEGPDIFACLAPWEGSGESVVVVVVVVEAL